MGLFSRLKEPVFFKKSKRLKEEYNYLTELCEQNNRLELKYKLDLVASAIKCEENIIHELKNSHIPMYVLQDVNLSCGRFKARIDFIIVTKFNVYVVETKDLNGNIHISNNGKFTREYEFNNKIYKEKIKSPIDISSRNMEVLKLAGYENKKMVDKIIFDKVFYSCYKPLIVLGNRNSLLNDKEASDNLKNKIVRIDRLINYIEETDKCSEHKFNKREMDKIAQGILDKHLEEIVFYDIIYKEYNEEHKFSDEELNSRLEKELKKYRYYVASRTNRTVSKVFNDKVLKQLIEDKPTTKKELLKIKGISKNIIEKYGTKINDIIKKYV